MRSSGNSGTDEERARNVLSRLQKCQTDAGLTDGQSAQLLLQLQADFLKLRKASPTAASVLRVEQELQTTARARRVRLRPSKWNFPRGMQDFQYIHGTSAKSGKEGSGDCAGLERNLLLLLHGFGGRKEPFVDFAQTMRLPLTACLVFNAPEALPEELLDDPPGFSWFSMWDETTGDFIQPSPKERRRLKSMESCKDLLWKAISVLTAEVGWCLNEIFLFGYGQGGSVVLDMLLQAPPASFGRASLGGTVAVAGEVLPERRHGTPRLEGQEAAVLLINGGKDRLTSPEAAEASAQYLRQALRGPVRLEIFPDRGAEMLHGERESRCFMEFLSEHLHGVGRKGSEEAMHKLGADPVSFTDDGLCVVKQVSDCFLDEMD
ncbi:unnamed protein product [Symbiodinium natans]|uniref:Phospholipase/carboxylesterase/thioesterase domain-containing protein n=1 Tax=Symbiodinium natans TaxID=878477 RepID=A0A812SUC3_9DINO|nr:unnamed protein product [Symbiodinium natans]